MQDEPIHASMKKQARGTKIRVFDHNSQRFISAPHLPFPASLRVFRSEPFGFFKVCIESKFLDIGTHPACTAAREEDGIPPGLTHSLVKNPLIETTALWKATTG